MTTLSFDPARVQMLRQAVGEATAALDRLASTDPLASAALASSRSVSQRLDHEFGQLFARILASEVLSACASVLLGGLPGTVWVELLAREHDGGDLTPDQQARVDELVVEVAAVTGAEPPPLDGLTAQLTAADPEVLDAVLGELGADGFADLFLKVSDTTWAGWTLDERQAAGAALGSAFVTAANHGEHVDEAYGSTLVTALDAVARADPEAADDAAAVTSLLFDSRLPPDVLAAAVNAFVDLERALGQLHPYFVDSAFAGYDDGRRGDDGSRFDPGRSAMFALADIPGAFGQVFGDVDRRTYLYSDRVWAVSPGSDAAAYTPMCVAVARNTTVEGRGLPQDLAEIASQFVNDVSARDDFGEEWAIDGAGRVAIAHVLGNNMRSVDRFHDSEADRRHAGGSTQRETTADGGSYVIAEFDPTALSRMVEAALSTAGGAAALRSELNAYYRTELDELTTGGEWDFDDPGLAGDLDETIVDLRRLETWIVERAWAAPIEGAERHDYFVNHFITAVDFVVDKVLDATAIGQHPLVDRGEDWLVSRARDHWASNGPETRQRMSAYYAARPMVFTYEIGAYLYEHGAFGPGFRLDTTNLAVNGDGTLRSATELAGVDGGLAAMEDVIHALDETSTGIGFDGDSLREDMVAAGVNGDD